MLKTLGLRHLGKNEPIDFLKEKRQVNLQVHLERPKRRANTCLRVQLRYEANARLKKYFTMESLILAQDER